MILPLTATLYPRVLEWLLADLPTGKRNLWSFISYIAEG
jgi:hypothetical protein